MNVVGLILGGGAGSRLQPLTAERAKPAVPIAGKYRLVDIPISNCINSGIRNIFLLTQFNSVSLHQHIGNTYRFDQFSGGHVRILAAEQTPDSAGWFQGTADAVRRSMRYFRDEDPDLVVILSGDQLYRMDLEEMINEHLERGADLTISTKPVAREEAGALGIMKTDKNGRIVRFAEKPGDSGLLDELKALRDDETYLASMGIYVFNMDVMRELLCNCDDSDFGKHIIPGAIDNFKVYSYIFEDYWEDIGTIRSFWAANLALTEPLPQFSFYDMSKVIYTRMRYLPPSKINQCNLSRCLLSDGCIISGERVDHCVVGLRALVGEGSVVEDSILMGADFYEHGLVDDPSGIPIGIGKNCRVKNAIIDKNVRIGDGVTISPEEKPENERTDLYWIRDGIMVIPKNTVIPSGTIL
ncbi:glucose-1-phosphate adenylyltransferase [Pontiella agarivorans]|uniref:Glucose-1-phosphate adenylyltransferase n=1 Tax=Pontiella agarivorans TaxID=3038953 RepID=A0ABU5N0A5_9BACT|nr:glucose-1-phosphate adenylyltransferase [Pontiella agarivorans]MDZ8119854.1 glucose-1-phosphate adenylyltransferase [Pontiella agarivorans]